MTPFNLTTDPWIPVRWADGRATSVSLNELFTRASEIADLSAPPHERISLMRLLICITQAALGAPATSDDWQDWGHDLEPATTAYLGTWKEHFNLTGEGPRFLQSPINEDKTEAPPTAKIVFHLSTGNSVTLLDHDADDKDPRPFAPAAVALALLTYQNHFDCDFMGQSPAFKGAPVAGTAIHALHSFLKGENLRQSIILNSIDTDSLRPGTIGKPLWEGGQPNDYLHRLVPAPCKLWVSNDYKRIRISKGIQYGKFSASNIRETSTTIVLSKIKGVETKMLLKAKISAAIWRDLHCLTVIQKSEASAPLTFRSHANDMDESNISFWSGELVKTKGKVLDSVESEFTVPPEMFQPAGQIRYANGVGFADTVSYRVKDAVKEYYASMKQRSAPTDSAQRHFWNSLDQQSGTLLALLKGLGTPDDPMGSKDFGKGSDPWTQAVRAAARAAYEHVCPRQNPRQLQAYAAGLKVLHPTPKKSAAKKSPASAKS